MKTGDLIALFDAWYVRWPLLLCAVALIFWVGWRWWHRPHVQRAPDAPQLPKKSAPEFRPLQYCLLLLIYAAFAALTVGILNNQFSEGLFSFIYRTRAAHTGLDLSDSFSSWSEVTYTLSFVFFTLHALLLSARRRLTLPAARLWGTFFLVAYWGILMAIQTHLLDEETNILTAILCLLSLLLLVPGFRLWRILLLFAFWGLLLSLQLGTLNVDFNMLLLWLVGLCLAIPAWLRFAQPAEPLNLLPLAIIYQTIAFISALGLLPWLPIACPIIALAGWFMPRHRQLRALLRPARLLPRPNPWKSQRGLTLIELLIVIAIIAIMSISVRNLTGAARRAHSRAGDRQAALALAEEQLARLRAQPALPSDGVHPFDAELLVPDPGATQSSYTIAAGPAPALRQVTFNLRYRHDAQDFDTQLGVLVPAGNGTKQ